MWRLAFVLAVLGACQPKPDPLTAELQRAPEKDLRGVLVMVDGKVVREDYFNGSGPDELHDIRSAGKSVTSLLVGIAIDQGLIRGVDQSLLALLGAPPSADRDAITLDDVLTMRTGLDAIDTDPASPGNEDRMDQAPDWLAFALAVPVRVPPGQEYVYASVNAFLAGAVVEKAAGMGLQEFAERHLFAPLGITRFVWRRGPRGEGAGQGNLQLRLRDFAALGQLVLDHGVHDGVQVVSAAWLDASLAARTPIASVDPYADDYGYFWYRKTYPLGGESVLVHFASGNGGNKIYVVPSRHMVVAITSRAYGQPYGQRRSEQILLRILAAGR